MSEVRRIGGFAEPCKTCRWVEDGGYCGNGASRNYGYSKSDEKIGTICPDWEAEPTDGPAELITVSREMVEAMAENSRMMGQYIGQLGTMIGVMQRRMEELERQQAAVTVRHEDVKRLNGMIRLRADQICGKYELTDPESRKIFRAAIKKDVMKRCGVKDLHDVPAAQLPGAENLISGWTNIRMAMERRAKR